MSNPKTYTKPAVEIICVEFKSYEEFQQMKLEEHLCNDLKPACENDCQYAYHESDTGYSECTNKQDLDCQTFNSDLEEEYYEITEPLENVA